MNERQERRTASSPVVVPSFGTLTALRTEGVQVGYRGIYIYLRYLAVLEVLAGLRFQRALGVGAGYGIFDRLLPADLDYTGIDVNAEAVLFAHAWAEVNRPAFRYLDRPLHECRFEDEVFDLVLLSEVAEHVPEADLPTLFAEIDRILAPGGRLLLSVPNHCHPRNRARRLLRRPTVMMDPTHLREYTLAGANDLVRRLPLRMERFQPAVLYLPLEPQVARLLPPQSRMRRAVINRFPQLCSHFVYLLRKDGGNGP